MWASRAIAFAMGVLGVVVAIAIAGGGAGAATPTSTGTSTTSPYGIVPTTTATTPKITTPITTTPKPTTSTTPTPTTPSPSPPVISAGPAGSAFAARGMWIWVLSSSDRGNLGAILRQSNASGVKTLLIKSSDGTQMWSQFSRRTVAALHAGGLHVCAWQFVYGVHPVQEAQAGAKAVKAGANCLVIDAESQYQGKYVQAQSYIRTLRKLIGSKFPVALAGFPYIDYHPAFPYSVFLGPGGAQVNTPQMYWRDIGTSVASVYTHTYEFNPLYERPIDPLGQVFESPPAAQIRQFQAAATAYRAAGVSWWDWQSATAAQWTAIAQPTGPLRGVPVRRTVASLARGAEGDLVVWAQEHLASAGQSIAVDGIFGPLTARAVERFQSRYRLPANGVITPATWSALLRFKPAAVTWVNRGHGQSATVPASGTSAHQQSRGELLSVPASAALAAVHDELPGSPGQGYPRRPGRARGRTDPQGP